MQRSCHSRILSLCAVLLLAPPAWGQSSAETADALFHRGLTAMEAGDHQKACPILATSYRLDPRPGTLFTLAECEAKADKLIAALAHYAEYLQAVGAMTGEARKRHEQRAEIAARAQKELDAQVPTLQLVLPAGAPAGVRVTRDGIELKEASLGIAERVDPGEHVITAQAPGSPLSEQRITLARGERKTLPLEVPKAAPVVVQKKVEVEPKIEPQETGSGQRVAGVVVGGLGVAGVVAGSIAGGVALSKAKVRNDNCNKEEKWCNPDGLAAQADGLLSSSVSTAGFVVGLAGLAAGAVLVLTAPSEKKHASAKATLRAGILGVGPNGAVIGMEGAF